MAQSGIDAVNEHLDELTKIFAKSVVSDLQGAIKSLSKDLPNKKSAEIVPMADRKGFVFCHDCVYCYPQTLRDKGDAYDDVLGTCVRRQKEEKRIFVSMDDGCFEGKPFPKELLVTLKLMEDGEVTP